MVAVGCLPLAVTAACASTTSVSARPPTSSPPGSFAGAKSCRYFNLSLAIDQGGKPSALLAARWFAGGHDGLAGRSVPGWASTVTADGRAIVKAGSTELRAVQLSDATSAIEAGQQCPPGSTSRSSGTIIGVLQAVGGPPPGTPRPLPGTITIRNWEGTTITASAGSAGTFSVQVPVGSYILTGHSHLYESGTSECTAAPPGTITVTAGGTIRTTIDCEER